MDTDWVGDIDTSCSLTGYILMMNGGPISWICCLYSVSLSTPEAELIAASQAGQAALYLRETLKDFGYQQNTVTEIYKHARSAVSETPVRRKFSRHIDISHYFVRELAVCSRNKCFTPGFVSGTQTHDSVQKTKVYHSEFDSTLRNELQCLLHERECLLHIYLIKKSQKTLRSKDIEIAAQKIPGRLGRGVKANYTTVDGRFLSLLNDVDGHGTSITRKVS